MNVRDFLIEYSGCDDLKFIQYDCFDNAIVGITVNNEVVYDYNLMISSFMDNENFSYDDAIMWIDCNVIRTLSYIENDAPIIIYSLKQQE